MVLGLNPKNSIWITTDVLAQGRTRGRTLLIDALLRSQVTPGRSDTEVSISGVKFNFTGPSGNTTGSARYTVPTLAHSLSGEPQVSRRQYRLREANRKRTRFLRNSSHHTSVIFIRKLAFNSGR